MQSLSVIDIESELSYAYLHAVASHAGMSCSLANRHRDNRGVDATITAWLDPKPGCLTEIDISVQLKATIKTPADDGARLSYFLAENDRYDDLRATTIATPRILVVLFLPSTSPEWLQHTTDQLVLKRCAYWQSLREAPPSTNQTGTTVYLPKTQAFTAQSLSQLAERLSRKEFPTYPAP